MVERSTALTEDSTWDVPPAHLQSCMEGEDVSYTFTPEGTPEQVEQYRDELRKASQTMWEFFVNEQRNWVEQIMAAR